MAEYINDPAIESYTPPPGILVSGHYNKPYGYSTFRSKGTRDWFLTYTLAGNGEYGLNGQVYSSSEYDVVILLPGTMHHYYTPTNSCWEFCWAHFVPEPRWSELLQLPEPAKGMISLHIEQQFVRERLLTAFQRLIRNSRENDFHSGMLSLNAMEEILMLLAQSHSKRSVLDPRVEETLNFLSQNMKKQFTIDELARRALLSPSRFSHLFKEQVGDSVMDWYLKLRLAHAARLLTHTSYQIALVADEVGFRSPFYFTKQFTIIYGMSPSKYRAQEITNQ